MERKTFKEVTVALLPPLFNQFDLSNQVTCFDLGDIVKKSSSSAKLNEKTKENFSTLINRITKVEFGKEIINMITLEGREIDSARIMLINYPINKNQMERLESDFENVGFNISKLIVTSLSSFDILMNAKEKNFLCPLCFKAYSKENNSNEKEYSCPLDKESFNIDYVNEFTDSLTTYYLKNSIDIIQYFSRNEKEKNRKVLTLNIESEEKLAENIKRSLLGIAENE